MDKSITTQEVTKVFQTIQTYLTNEEWIKSQQPDLIEALRGCESVVEALSQQIYIFLDCFEQYAHTLEATIRVPSFEVKPDSDEYTSPTQTSAEPVSLSLA